MCYVCDDGRRYFFWNQEIPLHNLYLFTDHKGNIHAQCFYWFTYLKLIVKLMGCPQCFIVDQVAGNNSKTTINSFACCVAMPLINPTVNLSLLDLGIGRFSKVVIMGWKFLLDPVPKWSERTWFSLFNIDNLHWVM